ncbi:MAG TPA: HAD hydrolase-like protein [Thermoanaerobaculia bacterium]|nr:HAD hydrolase-like protein [Thermoanaerobaculia bacterium]
MILLAARVVSRSNRGRRRAPRERGRRPGGRRAVEPSGEPLAGAPEGRSTPGQALATFVVFDLDGTLIDGYDAITESLAFAMTRLGRTALPEDRVRGMVGRGLEKLLEEAVGAADAAEGVRLFREHYAEVAVTGTRLMPNVAQVLAELASAGHRMAVASNKPAHFSRTILEAKGIAGYFLAVGGPGQQTPAKPDPKMLLDLIGMAGAGTADTVVVGDMEIDAEFARAAGCRAVLVPGGSRSREELQRFVASPAGTDVVLLHALTEFPGWLTAVS